ncbi:protein FAM171B isoform X2 [Esox lucius]|uniref:Membrane-associated ring finger (C3HC4) 7 n=1 Tax=Esox lucius TaxID=8010 RepID=A0A3P8ZEX7_ESOLU|nr:protein FAM171B isoform X2 [Esox lucius]
MTTCYVFGSRLPFAMPADRLYLLFLLVVISCGDGVVRVAAEAGFVTTTGLHTLLTAEDNGIATVPDGSSTGKMALYQWAQTPSPLTPELRFALRVLVKDQVTRRPLSGAQVEVFVNHTLWSQALTGERGEVLVRAPYSVGLSFIIVASMDGYVLTPMPWRTTKRPIFSSITLSLLPQNQGNIWLFDDSVLITGKLPDISNQPSVQFPKSLLKLSDSGNISTVTAYLTVPRHHLAKGCVNCSPGIIHNKSVFRSVELRALAALSTLLYSGGKEVEVRGPIQISLPLADTTNLRPSDTIPAWAFNSQTGAWENHGVGIVKMVGDTLVWTYMASHLGYWIAAHQPSSNGYMGHGSSLEFLSYHTYLLIGILGGTLLIVVGFLAVLLCHCGGSANSRSPRRRKARFSKLSVLKKDQTTSTHMEEAHAMMSLHPGDRSHGHCDQSSTPRHNKANYNIYVEDPGHGSSVPLYENLGGGARGPQASNHYVNSDEVARLRERSREEHNRAHLGGGAQLLHLYNQPMALVQATELFGSQGGEQQGSGCKSATFPRNGGDYDSHSCSEPGGQDSYAQTLPKNAHHTQGAKPQQDNQDQPQSLETPPQGPASTPGLWGRYNSLLESSLSVPGTLNEAAGMGSFGGGVGGPGELQGMSERTLLEMTRGKASSPHPRAWFVSLDGKPAASVRHSIIELHGRHPRPPSSNDTSLDSGVDMNEPQQSTRELDRERPSIRGSFPHHSRGRYSEDQDLSSSESGNTATCTPEDPYLRNILDGSSGAIPNIPEERDGMDTSSAQEDSESRGTPPPRRLRKVREKGRAEKRSARHHVREERPLVKRT